MTERAIRQFCHAVGNYLPCPRKQRQHILQNLRLRLEEYRSEHAEDSVTPEEQFGTPQQVAASYVDDMDTAELLAALRLRRKILTVVGIGVLAALCILIAALCTEIHQYRHAITGWSDQIITTIE